MFDLNWSMLSRCTWLSVQLCEGRLQCDTCRSPPSRGEQRVGALPPKSRHHRPHLRWATLHFCAMLASSPSGPLESTPAACQSTRCTNSLLLSARLCCCCSDGSSMSFCWLQVQGVPPPPPHHPQSQRRTSRPLCVLCIVQALCTASK